jgi:hypothetical protein
MQSSKDTISFNTIKLAEMDRFLSIEKLSNLQEFPISLDSKK